MKNTEKLYSVALVSVTLILALIIVSSTASASTLQVGGTAKYKTIQSAVNAAKSGDTLKVAYGTYKENIKIDKDLTIIGTKYPKVDGFIFEENKGTGTINGFSIQKYGTSGFYAGGYGTIRNNYFYNCGISLQGGSSSGANILNNKIKNGGIYLQDTNSQIIKGNTISNSEYGLFIGNMASVPTVSKNTFKNCKTAVFFQGWGGNPGQLTTFSGNKYIGNKVNIGWS